MRFPKEKGYSEQELLDFGLAKKNDKEESVKSAQYLAGHSNAQVTLDVYADSNVQQTCDELSSLYRKSLD